MCVIDSVWVVGVTMLALGWIWFHWGRGQTESVCVCVRPGMLLGEGLERVKLLKINNHTDTQTHMFKMLERYSHGAGLTICVC